MAPRHSATTTALLAPLLVLILVAVASDAAASKKVVVQVMYESLCPDSINFIKNQLTPAYEALGPQRMVVEFIPYGKASTYPTNTGYTFRCQHGPSECRGNKLQACGLSRLLADNAKQVRFVHCVMSLSNPARFSEKCAKEVGLEPDALKECASGREGQVLLAGMGEKTPSDIDFVPTVTFNGKSVDQDQALSNLVHLVCDNLTPADRPKSCER